MRSEAEDAVPQPPAQEDGLRSSMTDLQNVHRDKPSCKQPFGTEKLHEHSVTCVCTGEFSSHVQQQCIIEACAKVLAYQCCKSVSKSADISSKVRASIMMSVPIGRSQRNFITGDCQRFS